MSDFTTGTVVPPSLGGRVQLGFVVQDLDAALEYWTEKLGVGPFVVIEDPVGDAEFAHRGRPSRVKMSVAFSYVSDTMVELLTQSNDAPSAYREFLDRGESGLHHLGFWPDDFEGACADLVNAGFVEVTGMTTPDGTKAFAYYETPPHVGIMFEIVPLTATRKVYYGAIQQLAATWDGSRPVRRYKTYADFIASADCLPIPDQGQG